MRSQVLCALKKKTSMLVPIPQTCHIASLNQQTVTLMILARHPDGIRTKARMGEEMLLHSYEIIVMCFQAHQAENRVQTVPILRKSLTPGSRSASLPPPDHLFVLR